MAHVDAHKWIRRAQITSRIVLITTAVVTSMITYGLSILVAAIMLIWLEAVTWWMLAMLERR